MDKSNSTNTTVNDAEKVQRLVEERASVLLDKVLSESVKKYMLETIAEDDDETEIESEVDDAVESDDVADDTIESDDTSGDEPTSGEDTEDAVGDLTSIVDEPTSDEDVENDSPDESGWDEFEQFKDSNEEGVYDFTSVDDPEIVTKVYKLLNDDDNVVVVKNNDNIQINDNETGAEYIVKLGDVDVDDETIDTPITESVEDIVGFEGEGEEEVLDLNDLGDVEGLSISENDETEDEVIEEEETVDEVTTVTSNNARKTSKTNTSSVRKDNLPLGSKNISAGGQYVGDINEAIVNKALLIKEENSKLKSKLNEIHKVMNESLISNSNLCQIIKLFMENSTTKHEKEDILKRFGKDVNTLKEGTNLYESITRELSRKSKPTLTEKRVKSEKSIVNENTIKQTPEIQKTLDLMSRLKYI